MDTSFVIGWKELLVFAIIMLAIYVAELLLLMRSGRSSGGLFRRANKDESALTTLTERVNTLEKRLARLEKTDFSADNISGEEATTPYGKAFTLAKQGMDVAQVATACGISRAEAELIVAMQHKHLH